MLPFCYHLLPFCYLKDEKIIDDELIAEIFLRYINPYKKKLEHYISGDIPKFLTTPDQKSIDFLAFAKQYRDRLMKKKPNSAANFTTLINALEDFTNSEHLLSSEINYRFLTNFSAYLQKITTSRRTDGAFISIPIVAQARELIDKYATTKNDRPFSFQKKYSTSDNFLRHINTGLRAIAPKLKIGQNLTMYVARHTWTTIARNECGYSLDDVAVALNHSLVNRITDRYIRQDWSLIDRMNADVLKKIL